MIFPGLRYLGSFEANDSLVFTYVDVPGIVRSGALSIPEPWFIKEYEILKDGASVQVDWHDENQDGGRCKVSFGERVKTFDRCLPEHFGNGWLVARYTSGEHAHSFFAYNYLNENIIQFLENARRVCVRDGFFFVEGCDSWNVHDESGSIVASLDASDASCFLERPYYHVIDNLVFMGGGGLGDNKILHVFSPEEGRLLKSVTWSNHINSLTKAGEDYYFIDHQHLYRLNPAAPENSKALATLPAPSGVSAWRGYEQLWWDGHCLYVASFRGNFIQAYDLDGNPLPSPSIPKGWQVFLYGDSGVSFMANFNIVCLHEEGTFATGPGGILTWKAGQFADPGVMEIEHIQGWSFEPIAGKKNKYGYRVRASDPSGEHLVRHAGHHLLALVDRVAPGTINGARIGEKDFNGVLELILITPQRDFLEASHVQYLIDLFGQMCRMPINYRSSNNRDRLSLKIFWQNVNDGEATELIYDSTAMPSI